MNPETNAVPPPDRQRFGALARDHHRCLLIYARALSRNEATAADLVQDALIAAWKNIGRFDVTRDFGAWLRGIIRNKWREHLRRHSREVDVDDTILEAWESRLTKWDGGGDSGNADLFEALEDCLKRLPEPLDDTVRRFYYREEAGESLAATLGIAPATLRKRLQRAREALRDCLDRKIPNHA